MAPGPAPQPFRRQHYRHSSLIANRYNVRPGRHAVDGGPGRVSQGTHFRSPANLSTRVSKLTVTNNTERQRFRIEPIHNPTDGPLSARYPDDTFRPQGSQRDRTRVKDVKIF
jgi:hypothetical protein